MCLVPVSGGACRRRRLEGECFGGTFGSGGTTSITGGYGASRSGNADRSRNAFVLFYDRVPSRLREPSAGAKQTEAGGLKSIRGGIRAGACQLRARAVPCCCACVGVRVPQRRMPANREGCASLTVAPPPSSSCLLSLGVLASKLLAQARQRRAAAGNRGLIPPQIFNEIWTENKRHWLKRSVCVSRLMPLLLLPPPPGTRVVGACDTALTFPSPLDAACMCGGRYDKRYFDFMWQLMSAAGGAQPDAVAAYPEGGISSEEDAVRHVRTRAVCVLVCVLRVCGM